MDYEKGSIAVTLNEIKSTLPSQLVRVGGLVTMGNNVAKTFLPPAGLIWLGGAAAPGSWAEGPERPQTGRASCCSAWWFCPSNKLMITSSEVLGGSGTNTLESK